MISAPIVEFDGQRVLTTTKLASAFGLRSRVLENNFKRNRHKFKYGTHYFVVRGLELSMFKAEFPSLVPSGSGAIYLWTESGSVVHARTIEDNEVWDAYDDLVRCYFHAAAGVNSSSRISGPNYRVFRLVNRKGAIQELPFREWGGVLVLSSSDIDVLFGWHRGSSRERFGKLQESLVEGVDYFIALRDMLPHSTWRWLGFSNDLYPYGIVLTRSGYLALVAKLKVDGDVHEQLTHYYFRGFAEDPARLNDLLTDPEVVDGMR